MFPAHDLKIDSFSLILLVYWVKQEPGRVLYVSLFYDTHYIIELEFQFVNAVTGSNLAVGQNLRGCTTDIQVAIGTQAAPEDKLGRKVVFVDTPAFDIELDDNSEIKIKKQLEKWRKKKWVVYGPRKKIRCWYLIFKLHREGCDGNYLFAQNLGEPNQRTPT